MLQYDIVHPLLKPAVRGRLPPDAVHLSTIPINALQGLDKGTLAALRDLKVQTLGDLVQRADVLRPVIPSSIIEKLYCLIFWPAYDPGPNCAWAQLLNQAPLASYQALPTTFRLDFGPVYYRGRLDGTARVLIVGQDPSTDELLAQRIFVGKAGQRLQRLLGKLGLTRSYIMLNTYLWGIFGQYSAVQTALQGNPNVATAIRSYRERLFDRVKATNTLQAILAFGNPAHDAVAQWPGASGIPCFNLTHPTADDAYVLPNWNSKLAAMQAGITPDDATLVDASQCAASTDPAAYSDVPRRDLPFGVPAWHGTGGGTHSQRNGNTQIVWSSTVV